MEKKTSIVEMAENRNEDISRTTILNLPALVWENIRREFLIHPEKELINLCLASSVLDSMVTEDLRRMKWMLLGEQVLPLLTKDLYLNRHDLENLIDTKSDYLGKFAAISWCTLNQPNFELVDLHNAKMVRKFEENVDAKKNENRIWAAFAGKMFLFVSHKIGSIRHRLVKHGKYLLFFRVMEFEGKHYKFATTSFTNSWKLKLPNLQNILVQKKISRKVYTELLTTGVNQTTKSRGQRLIERYREIQGKQ